MLLQWVIILVFRLWRFLLQYTNIFNSWLCVSRTIIFCICNFQICSIYLSRDCIFLLECHSVAISVINSCDSMHCRNRYVLCCRVEGSQIIDHKKTRGRESRSYRHRLRSNAWIQRRWRGCYHNPVKRELPRIEYFKLIWVVV